MSPTSHNMTLVLSLIFLQLTESLGCVVIVDSLAIEEETKRGDRHPLTFTAKGKSQPGTYMELDSKTIWMPNEWKLFWL